MLFLFLTLCFEERLKTIIIDWPSNFWKKNGIVCLVNLQVILHKFWNQRNYTHVLFVKYKKKENSYVKY